MTGTLDVDRLRHSWNDIRAQVRQKWASLSEDDLVIHGGRVDQFLDRLHKVTGEDRGTIESYLSGLMYGSPQAVARYAVEAREALAARGAAAAHRVRRAPAGSFAMSVGIGLAAGCLVGLAIRKR